VTTTDTTTPELSTGVDANRKIHVAFAATTDRPNDPKAANMVQWHLADDEGNTIAWGNGLSGDAKFTSPGSGKFTLTGMVKTTSHGFNPSPGDENMLKVVANDTSIKFWYPYEDKMWASEKPYLISSVEVIDGGRIKVMMEQGTGWKKAYDFGDVMKGINVLHDTDSAQFAIRYKDSSGVPIGDGDYNALKQEKRTSAARWTAGTTAAGNPYVSQQADHSIPSAATDVDIVLVFTDTLDNKPSDFRQSARNWGDIPIIMGYWHGHKNSTTGTWDWTKLDTTPTTVAYPDAATYEACVLNAQNFVNLKTGFVLRARPIALETAAHAYIAYLNEHSGDDPPDPTRLATLRAKAVKAVDDAFAAGTINDRMDTGFDIVKVN
jgi:hypothetical protein